jgi:hypothetical protein
MHHPRPRQPGKFLRRKFSPEEDITLRNLVESIGTKSWEEIAKFIPDRSARQCRDRFKNYLMDSLVTEAWTPQEDAMVVQQFHLIGPKWVEIGKLLSGRSGNNVKNRWHKHLCKLDHGAPNSPPAERIEPSQRETPPVLEEAPAVNLPSITFGESDWPWLFTSVEVPNSLETVWSNVFSFGDSLV